MCFYEYCSKVYKTKFTDEQKKKHLERDNNKKPRARKEEEHLFSTNHPQSETHWQKKRLNAMVPTLSKLPPNSSTHKDKFQKCMLLLFKPFTCLFDL